MNGKNIIKVNFVKITINSKFMRIKKVINEIINNF